MYTRSKFIKYRNSISSKTLVLAASVLKGTVQVSAILLFIIFKLVPLFRQEADSPAQLWKLPSPHCGGWWLPLKAIRCFINSIQTWLVLRQKFQASIDHCVIHLGVQQPWCSCLPWASSSVFLKPKAETEQDYSKNFNSTDMKEKIDGQIKLTPLFLSHLFQR